MTDKSRLELDVEKKEQLKGPFSAFVLLIIFSAIAFGLAGIYVMKLRHEISAKDMTINSLKSEHDNEKAALLIRVKRLEKENEDLRSGLISLQINPGAAPSLSREEVK
ncbi:MAG: hypothetical protein HY758_04590 [Nitrospirae bacterium]|nr:hypothetical protein [Nitrospirota bacterium]